MSLKTYLLTLVGVTGVWVVALLTIPAFARLIEGLMLLFLSTTAG